METRCAAWLLCALLAPTALGAAGSPLAFVPNRGQTGPAVRFHAAGAGVSAWFEDEAVTLRHRESMVRVTFEDRRPGTVPRAEAPLSGQANFLRGSDPRAWFHGIPLFGTVRYPEVYPGIDAVYHGQNGRLKSEFRVAAGADPARILLQYSGARRVELAPDGALLVQVAGGTLREAPPDAWQDLPGGRRPVGIRYRLQGPDRVGFSLESYDPGLPLVIDPLVSYVTYLGGSGMDAVVAVAAGSDGSTYLAGYTDSPDFIQTGGAWPRGGGVDAFVAKLSPQGGQIEFCTYFGGAGDDRAAALALDTAGDIYLGGTTASNNLPTRAALQPSRRGLKDGFLARLTADGANLVFSTYYGGAGNDAILALAVSAVGVSFAGETTSPDLRSVSALQATYRGGATDSFVGRIGTAGTPLLVASYLGGAGQDRVRALAVDSVGSFYLAGDTTSGNWPVAGAVRATLAGGQDAFVTKLASAGNALIYSTYLGGSGGVLGGYPESAAAIAVDGQGGVTVAGTTASADFPLLNAAQATMGGGGTDGFVTRLNGSGHLVYSTYLGGRGYDAIQALVLETGGGVYLAGYTSSDNLAAPEGSYRGQYDGFLARLSADGRTVRQSAYYGGTGNDSLSAIALREGDVYLAGQTASGDLTPLNPAQGQLAGTADGFVIRRSIPLALQGRVDWMGCDYIAGWAWNANRPNEPIDVAVYAGSELLGVVRADWYRPDLLAAGIGNGAHGVYLDIPDRLHDGQPRTIQLVYVDTGAHLAGSPRALTCGGLEGRDDTANCSYLAGWVWDRTRPTRVISVDLYEGLNLLATIPAATYRPDLAAAGIGGGHHGYYLAFPPQLKDGQPHTIRAFAAETGVALAGTGRTVTCSGLEGREDTASCSYLAGWAWDRNAPNTPVSVDILADGQLLTSRVADIYRPDLAAAGIGNGYHGYYYAFPGGLKDGLPHAITVRISNSSVLLATTGRTLTCAAP